MDILYTLTMKRTKQDTDDRCGAGKGCSRNVHLQVTPEMYRELEAAWRSTTWPCRNDFIRAAIQMMVDWCKRARTK